MEKTNDFIHGGLYPVPEGMTEFGIMPVWGGHQRTSSADYRWDGMRRGSERRILWQYTLAGCGAVEIDGKSLPVRAGEAFLLQVPEKHCYYLPETPGTWEFIYCGLSGDEAWRLTGKLRERCGSVSAAYGSPATVEAAWEMLRNIGNPLTAGSELSAQAYRFLMTMFTPADSGSSAGGLPVEKIHHYIVSNITREITLDDLAAFAGYSRSHFSRIFRETSGRSVHNYLLKVRMDMALLKLQSENISVKETAEACGFADCSYFCKVFRKFHGTTPAHFLKRRKI